MEFPLFHQAFQASKSNGRRVVGYVGSVDFRLDYPLLRNVISNHPNLEFHFVGRITDDEGNAILSSFSNVHLFGAVNPETIPSYMKKFDVAVIPFAKNDFTKNIYPLKINEYLAAGLRVVTTDFADLTDFEGVVSITKSKAGFEEKLLESLGEQSETERTQRVDTARRNDWSYRAIDMEFILAGV